MYCGKFIDPNDINGIFNNFRTLSNISTVIFAMEFIIIILVLIRLITKCCEMMKVYSILQYIILVSVLVCLILSIVFCIICKSTWSYFNSFQTECQVNNVVISANSNKVGPLDQAMLDKISHLTAYSLILALFYSLFI